jgi:PAS domain S-box-containing protein
MSDDAEPQRLKALQAYAILDTAPEAAFDRLTTLAAALFDAPIALVSLIDAERQWFKSRHGLDAVSTPRSWAFCAHAIAQDARTTLVVEDASRDLRFRANPLVTGDPNIRFYAGAVLTGSDGYNLGTLCVIDRKPRPAPSAEALAKLSVLAEMVVDELELRRALRLAQEKQSLLEMAERLSGVGRWRLDLTSSALTWSDEVYRIHGVAPESFPLDFAAVLAFYSEAEGTALTGLIEQARRTGQGFTHRLNARRADGEVRHIVFKADCQLSEQGVVTALYGVVQDVTDHERALAAVETSKARYKLLADNVCDVIFQIDLNGRGIYSSPSMQRLLGYEPAELAGLNALSFVYEPDRRLVGSVLGDLSMGVETKVVSYRALHKDGRPVWVEARLQLVRNAAGAPAEIIGVVRDITTRKALEDEMQAARDVAEAQARRAELTEELAGLGHWRLDARTREQTWSPQLHRIYGLAPDQPVDVAQVAARIHPDDRAGAAARVKTVLAGGVVDEDTTTRFVGDQGEIRYLSTRWRAERSADGAVTAAIGAVIDLTDRMTAQQALADSETKYRALAEHSMDVILRIGPGDVIRYVSPSCRRFGYDPDDLIGRTGFDIVHPDDHAHLQAVITELFTTGLVDPKIDRTYRLRTKDGGYVWMEGNPSIVRDETGAPTEVVSVMRDVSERKRLEAELVVLKEAAEAAARVKAEFLANMSHELRTPLTSILGFTRLAAEQDDLTGLTRNYVERVGVASRALLSTVNDILDFSKLEAGQVRLHPQPTAVAELARGVLELFLPQAGAKDLDLQLDSGAEDIALLIDPDRVRQLLLNLVGNAVKFTECGAVSLRTRYDPAAGVLCVEVTDSGAGIPPEKQGRLFQRFSQVDGSLTRSSGGTGLGLAICKGLVEAMGGEIGVDSPPAGGATFWFQIPAPPASLPAIGGESAGDCSAIEGLRVLVVDDHPPNRELARLVLMGLGAEILEAEDGEAAVRIAAEWPLDVILMDLRMPRLDGFGALKQIRAGHGPNDTIPILAFTADVDAACAQRLLAAGFDGVVAKPLDLEALIAAIADATAIDLGPPQTAHANAD